MKIASNQLDAFHETAKLRSFSKAASQLGITQSALSQRVAHLENDLEVTLFIRDPAGLMLTTAGEMLLRHCQVTSSLEQEILNQLKSSADELRGTIRIAAFSSVLRSVVLPSLAVFLRAHPHVNCEFRSYEVAELYDILRNAEADFVVLDYQLHKKGVVEKILGKEEYVVIESSKYNSPEGLYLDNAPEDNASEVFFNEQGSLPKNFRRSFMGDVYGILSGVENGLGRAVMSKHLLKANSKVKLVRGYKPYARTVTLNYFAQAFYSRLHQEIAKQLIQNTPEYL